MTANRIESRSRTGAPHQVWTLVIASLGLFMTALDTLVVTTALPVLRVALKAGITDLEWTVNAYNLSFACFLLTGAALGDRFGRKQMFALGITVFTAASAAAALSPSVGALIAARALQGAGAAIIMPLTLTLISAAFPAEKRGMAIGLWGGIAGLAVAAGPVVGGAVAGGINWHWIFWLNIPVGAALIPLAITKLTESYGPRPRLDLTGLALAGAGLLGIAWGLVRGNDAGWSSAEIITALSGGAVLLVAFIGWEARSSHPMLPLGLFRSRGFASANGVSFFMYAGLFGTLFLMAQFLQSALGDSPLRAGIVMLPWTAAPMVIAPIAGTLADRYGNRRFMVAGLAAQAIGYGWVAAIAATGMSNFMLAAALTVAGVGTSLCFPTVANAVLGSVPPSEAGVASGTNSAIREIGGVLGVAVLAAVFTSHGGYTSPHVFIEGFRPALWAGAGFSALGIVAALAGVRHAAKEKQPAAPGTVPELIAAA
jgi:EmrB/QacA subfamily drug resistance transporter